MELVALSPFGVELRDVDLREPLGAGDVASLARAWHEHRLLVARDQHLDGEAQVAFASRFGPVFTYGGYQAWTGRWGFVSNTEPAGALRTGPLLFHSDHAFDEHPLKALCLHALEVPGEGGATRFVDAVLAHRTLPRDLRDRIAGLSAVHCFDLADPAGDRLHRLAGLPDAAPRAVHPLSWPHPETGEPILYVSRMQTDHVVGLPPDDGAALLDALCEHLYRPEHELEHRWRVGDVVCWDNRALQHARTDFDADQPRTLRRVTIAEDGLVVGAAA